MLDPERLLGLLPPLILLLPLFSFVVLALFGDAINRDREQKGAMILACVVVLVSFALSVWTAWSWRQWAGQQLAARVDRATLVDADADAGAGAEATHDVVVHQRSDRTYFFKRIPLMMETVRADAGLPPRARTFIEVGGLVVPFFFLIDPLTLVMMLVVTGIGSLIHIYSVGYMSHDDGRVRYFSYLNLFTFFMLLLVMGASLPLMFIGWEGVGLCSYLLIGFWFKKKSATDAGNKAFIVNRIGDAGLILAMALAFATFRTLDLVSIVDRVQQAPAATMGVTVTAIALLLFLGACGKSAQIPLHVWLPDAMEGPTPVSALIHAATMVTAGVYMVCRLGPLYLYSETAMGVVAIVGTATALMAATIALVQTDIKKVLAYSTVSQLGYMFLACGVGAFGVAVFHLFTHAFFKALLFLGSGSVIHALSGEQDMRHMGGLRNKIPWTFWTFVIGTVAIAGIWPFAGFFSKDAILIAAWEHHKVTLFVIAVLTALLTAFYMWRMLSLTFFGSYRGNLEHSGSGHAHDASHDHGDKAHDHGHGGIHESPWSMLVPLILLAIGSATVGFIDIPAIVAPAVRAQAAGHGAHPSWIPALALASAVLGIAAAWYLYVLRPDVPKALGATFAAVRRVFEAKWGFDDAFNWVARRVVVQGSASVLWRGVDAAVIDGAVNGAGQATSAVADASRMVQSGLVRLYVLMILGGAVILLTYMLWLAR